MLLTATGCGRRGDMTQPPCHEEKNGVYYWKTVLQLDSADLAFMRCHDVGRVYLRMFDVAVDDNDVTETPAAVPVASVRIGKAENGLMKNELAGIEFVPVVYITTDALRSMAGREKELAGNIVTRVRNICSLQRSAQCGGDAARLRLDKVDRAIVFHPVQGGKGRD